MKSVTESKRGSIARTGNRNEDTPPVVSPVLVSFSLSLEKRPGSSKVRGGIDRQGIVVLRVYLDGTIFNEIRDRDDIPILLRVPPILESSHISRDYRARETEKRNREKFVPAR